MGMPAGAVELIGCPLFGLLSLQIPHRSGIATFVMLLTDALFCVFAFSGNKTARLAPNYSGAKIAMIVGNCATVCIMALYFLNWKDNKRRGREE